MAIARIPRQSRDDEMDRNIEISPDELVAKGGVALDLGDGRGHPGGGEST